MRSIAARISCVSVGVTSTPASPITSGSDDTFDAITGTPPAMAKLQAMGVIRVGNSAAEFQSFMATEFELYKKIIQDAGIKAE